MWSLAPTPRGCGRSLTSSFFGGLDPRQGAQVLIYLTYTANPAEPPGVWRAHLSQQRGDVVGVTWHT